jgi:uncharacterized membrane protein
MIAYPSTWRRSIMPGAKGRRGCGGGGGDNEEGHMAARHLHPVNQAMVDEAPLGARIADRVTGFMGSWKFIIVQTVIVTIWIVGNVALLFHFDIYPFILLNLAFSTQAAYAAPLILLAGNRQALRDRLTLEHAASETDKEDKQNQDLLKGNAEILKRIEALEQQILQLETKILGRLDSQAGGNGGEGGAASG